MGDAEGHHPEVRIIFIYTKCTDEDKRQFALILPFLEGGRQGGAHQIQRSRQDIPMAPLTPFRRPDRMGPRFTNVLFLARARTPSVFV